MKQKSHIRSEYIEKRNGLSPEEARNRSSRIQKKLFAMEEYQACETVFVYVNMRTEVETVPIIHDAWRNGKRVAVPVVVQEQGKMFFIEITGFDGLKRSKFGVMEPEWCEEQIVPCDHKTVIITPGLAFDQKKFRLGYGGGYYDKFFGENNCLARIGLAYDFQCISELPVEDFDIPVDCVVTDIEGAL